MFFVFKPIILTEAHMITLLELTGPFIWEYTAHFILLV